MATTYQSKHTGQFIDDQISAVSEKLPLTGGVITGNLQANKFVGPLEGNATSATTATTAAACSGNAATATKLASKTTIQLSGDVSGSVNFDGSNDVNIVTTVADNSHSHTWSNISDGTTCSINTSGIITGSKVRGAVWNDYAEYRICNESFAPGMVVKENGDDTMSISTARLERGCSLISDTFGFAIGETDEAKCPIAVSGRVLAMPYESKDDFVAHIGWPVCSGPNGTVSIMTEEEEAQYPSRIIGTISAVPEYETWGTGNVAVNGRVWIKVK